MIFILIFNINLNEITITINYLLLKKCIWKYIKKLIRLRDDISKNYIIWL